MHVEFEFRGCWGEVRWVGERTFLIRKALVAEVGTLSGARFGAST